MKVLLLCCYFFWFAVVEGMVWRRGAVAAVATADAVSLV